MNKKLSIMIALLAGLALSQPVAAKDFGLYFGASIGSGNVEVDDLSFDENDFAWKLYGGYTLGSWLGIEAGYVDFGSPSGSVGGGVQGKSDVSGFDAFGIVGFPLGPIRIFGKLGGIYWDGDVKFDDGSPSSSDDGVDIGAGVGLEFSLFSVALRAEVEYFDALDDLYLATVGATWTF
jgi:hypothetical protein